MNAQAAGIDFQAIRRDHPIAETVNRYIELRHRGGALVGLCPFHADRRPSFEVVPTKGKAFCNACGWHGDVVDFVAEFENTELAEAARKLSGGDLPVDRPALQHLPPDESEDWTPILPAPAHAPSFDAAHVYNPRRGREVNWRKAMTRCDAYLSAAGQVLGYVVRMEIDGQKLTPTVTWARHRDGREAWVSGRFPNPRPLQGLDELARRPEAVVLVVSGEKCREAAARALPGFVAVTWAGGDQNVGKADWSPLQGRRVTIWPDADDSGRTAAETLALRLTARATELRVIDTADMPKGWDIADAVRDGWDTAAIKTWAAARVRTWTPSIEPEPEPEKKTPPSDGVQVSGSEAGEAPVEPSSGDDADRPNATLSDAVSATVIDPVIKQTVEPPVPSAGTDLDATVDANAEDMPDRYSEDNVALAFSSRYANDFRYVAPWGRWMRWHDQRWLPDDTILVFDEVRKLCRGAVEFARRDVELTPKQKAAIATKFGASTTVASVERFARADRRHAATVGQWDADPWLLNTPDGVVDLRTGSTAAGSRTAYMTKITRVAPGGACEAWQQFLITATGGDHDLIAFLQRMAGYCLTGSTRDHALFFVYGTGGNGKGTFLNTLQWIIGDYAKSAPADMFTERKHEAHSTELARLMGARLVAAQETEEGKRWAEAKIKALTGGDPVTARFMRQDDFEFIPQFKLVMTGNHKPGLRNVDEAIKRRLHLIPFTVTIAPQDRDATLPDRLKAEAGGILRWAIEGCIQWQRDGLRPPAAVVAATDEYLEQQDVLGTWIDESCDVGPGYSARRSSLYRSFKSWAERSGEYVLPQKRWIAAVEARGIKSRIKDGIQFCDGLRVKLDEDYGNFGSREWEP